VAHLKAPQVDFLWGVLITEVSGLRAGSQDPILT
jgi:hypothetical protein